jgi:hypothetical protein
MTIYDAKSELRYPPKITWLTVAVEVGFIALAMIILLAVAG